MKDKRVIIGIGIIVLLVLGGVIYYFTKDFSKEISLDNYFSMREKEKNGFIFVYDEGNTSKEMLELVETIAQNERTMVKCLDFSNITQKQSEKFMKADDYTKSGVIIPMIMKLENGKIDSYIAGHVSEKDLTKFITNKEK